MKTIYIINQLAFCTTLLLYLTIIFGMYAQAVLGPLQLILALLTTMLYYKKLALRTKRFLIFYWMLAVAVIALAWSTKDYSSYTPIITLFVIPMLTAGYFLYVTALANTDLKVYNHENTKATNPDI